jgi:hypothetical protein
MKEENGTLNQHSGMNDYEKMIVEAAKSNSSELISNHTKNHTKVILENMVENATQNVLIYDRDLSGDLLNLDDKKLLRQFQAFLESDSNRTIEIIVDPSQNHNDTVVEELKKMKNKSLKIFQLNMANLKKIDREYVDIPYFSVSDNKAYRLEVKGTSKARNAVASFNDPEMGQSLAAIFQSLKSVSEPI